MKKTDLTDGNIYIGIFLFVLPIIGGNLFQQLYITADAVIVGQFAGKQGLAAIDSVSTLFRFPLNFMNGLSAGATIILARLWGANQIDKLLSAIKASLWIGIILGGIGSVIGVIFCPYFLQLLIVPNDIFAEALIYSRVYFAGLLSVILYNISAGILRALGDSKSPFYVLVISSILNVAADYILIGFLGLGILGAVLATLFSQICSVFGCIYALYRILANKKVRNIRTKEIRMEVHGYSMQILRTGFPLALQSMLFPVANSIIQTGINSLGTDVIAAWSISGKLDMLIWLMADSMSPALTTYVSQNIGAKKLWRVRKGAIAGTMLSLLFSIIYSIILVFFGGTMGQWFIEKGAYPVIIPLVTRYLRMMAPFYGFYAIAEALSGACCGFGDTIRPMIITAVFTCILRIIGMWIGFLHTISMEFIINVCILSWVTTALGFALLFYTKQRKLF